MENITISLVDNDYKLHARTNIPPNGNDDPIRDFLNRMKDELTTGQTAHLEIEGLDSKISTFEISLME